MLRNWAVRSVVGAAAVASALVFAAPMVAASPPVSKALQKQFLAIDAPLAKASGIWTKATEAVPASASMALIVKTLDKISPPFVAAIKTFDIKLAALHLPGKAGTDANAIMKDDKQFVTLLGSVAKMTKSQWVSGFSAIIREEVPLEVAFPKDMGLPADASIVI